MLAGPMVQLRVDLTVANWAGPTVSERDDKWAEPMAALLAEVTVLLRAE